MSERIPMQVGELLPEELRLLVEHLPFDLTFVDEHHTVRWYSPHRIFERSPCDIGKDVATCHSPATRPHVERIMSELQSGRRDSAEFLTEHDARPVSVRYLALRDADGAYRGMFEIAQLVGDVWPAADQPAAG